MYKLNTQFFSSQVPFSKIPKWRRWTWLFADTVECSDHKSVQKIMFLSSLPHSSGQKSTSVENTVRTHTDFLPEGALLAFLETYKKNLAVLETLHQYI